MSYTTETTDTVKDYDILLEEYKTELNKQKEYMLFIQECVTEEEYYGVWKIKDYQILYNIFKNESVKYYNIILLLQEYILEDEYYYSKNVKKEYCTDYISKEINNWENESNEFNGFEMNGSGYCDF